MIISWMGARDVSFQLNMILYITLSEVIKFSPIAKKGYESQF